MNTGKKLVLIIGILVCLLGLSYFLYTNFRDRKPDETPIVFDEQPRGVITKNEPNRINLIQDGLLHLYSMDEKYVSLLADAAPPAKLDTLQRSILRMEKSLRLSIDSLYTTTGSSSDQSAANFYKKMIDNRNLLRLAQGTGSTGSIPSMDEKAIQDLQLLLLKKNEEIMSLQDAKGRDEDGLQVSPNEDASTMAKLKSKEQAYLELQQKYSTLEQANLALTRRINDSEAKPKFSSSDPTENKINDLEAALRLAQVDCNLTRADGREIISNSKQRKALLEESLRILNSLANNDNKTVQKSVKDKLAELNHIASMIRD